MLRMTEKDVEATPNRPTKSFVPPDKQVGDGMLVTLEGRREPAEDRRYPENNYAFSDDGFPAEAVVPVVVARVADPVPVRVEVQVLEQFVSGASVQDGAAHLRDGFREHRGIRGHP